MNLTIISPAKNEAKNLPELIKRTFALAKKHFLNLEFILVDDHSSDATNSVISKLKKTYPSLRLIKSEGYGPGAALITGFRHARFPTVVTLDSDLSHDPEVIPLFLQELKRTRADIVIGSRFMKGGQADLPTHRLFFSRFMGLLVSLLTRHRIYDATSGFRIQKLAAIKKLQLKNPGFPIHLEIPLKAILGRYRVREYPIHYLKRKHGLSKMRAFKIGPSYLRVLFMETLKHSLAPLFRFANQV